MTTAPLPGTTLGELAVLGWLTVQMSRLPIAGCAAAMGEVLVAPCMTAWRQRTYQGAGLHLTCVPLSCVCIRRHAARGRSAAHWLQDAGHTRRAARAPGKAHTMPGQGWPAGSRWSRAACSKQGVSVVQLSVCVSPRQYPACCAPRSWPATSPPMRCAWCCRGGRSSPAHSASAPGRWAATAAGAVEEQLG